MLIIFDSTEIDSTLSGYTTSAQLHFDFYSKVENNLIFGTYTAAISLYYGFYSKIYIDNMFITSTQTESLYYNKTDTGNLLASRICGVGDISLPGMLDIGTSGYTN